MLFDKVDTTNLKKIFPLGVTQIVGTLREGEEGTKSVQAEGVSRQSVRML